MSCEGRDYLLKTIDSIDKSNKIVLFFQQYSKGLIGIGLTPEQFRINSILIINKTLYTEVQLNAQWHYSYILQNAKHNNDSIILIEDDVIVSKKFNQYIEQIKSELPERYILALYTPSPHFISNLQLIEYGIANFYGTQAMMYDIITAEELGKHILENIGKEPYDLAIKTYCKKNNIPLLTLTYSLVEHIGDISTGLGGGHKAGRFIDNYIK
jgi:hypothetical protein